MGFKEHSATAIESAITVLENFSHTSKSSSLSSLRNLIVTAFSKRAREQQEEKRQQIRKTVLHAVETLSNHQKLILKMQVGDAEEQKLAASATAAIARFNAVLASSESHPFSQWIPHLNEKNLFESLDSRRFQFSAKTPQTYEKVLQTFRLHTLPTLSQSELMHRQEVDVLRMKASMLLQQQGIGLATKSELLQIIREADIDTISESHLKTARLTMNFLPGLAIQVQGCFKNSGHGRPQIPLVDRFELATHVSHAGFPHPIQYIGWGLSDILLPTFSDELEAYRHKIISYLDPYSPENRISSARQLIQIKRQNFAENQISMLTQHQSIASAFSKYADETVRAGYLKTVDLFFNDLKTLTYAYDHLGETYELLNHYFLVLPYHHLQEVWCKQVHAHSSENLSVWVEEVLTEEMEQNKTKLLERKKGDAVDIDHHTIDYLIALGTILWPPFKNLMMRNLAPLLGFLPPNLDPGSQKLQQLAQRQQVSYREELEIDLQETTVEMIKQRTLNEFQNVMIGLEGSL